MEDKVLIKGLEVNLERNRKVMVTVDIYLDKDGRLEIVPLTRMGDVPDWSYVLGERRNDPGELTLYSKYIGDDEEE